jgi:hypothetical protein
MINCKRDYKIQKFSRDCKRARMGTSTVEVNEDLQIKWYKNTMNSEEMYLCPEMPSEDNESGLSLAPEPHIINDDYVQSKLSLAPQVNIERIR